MDTAGLEVVAVNDLLSIDNAAYLLKYDSVYGPYERKVEIKQDQLVINGNAIHYSSIKDPALLLRVFFVICLNVSIPYFIPREVAPFYALSPFRCRGS